MGFSRGFAFLVGITSIMLDIRLFATVVFKLFPFTRPFSVQYAKPDYLIIQRFAIVKRSFFLERFRITAVKSFEI